MTRQKIPQATATYEELLSPREIMARFRIPKTTLNRLVRLGAFPRPLMLGARMPRWRAGDVEAHLVRLARAGAGRAAP